MAQQFYLKGSNEAVIIDDKPFAGGGEGGLFNIQSPTRFAKHVAKIFHPHKRDDQHREAKINYLINNRPNFEYNPGHQTIIWVEQALYDEKGKFAGFIMPRATGEKLEVLCSPRLPKNLGEEWQRLEFGHEDALRLRIKVCYNIAAAIHQIHATGKYVLVDLKPDNILIHSNGLISLVDMDSIEIIENGKTVFPATVVTPEYTPPEYYEGIRPGDSVIENTWDQFSLAVIFYRLLLGIHPFAASAVPPYDNLVSLGDKIHHGLYVHHQNKNEVFSIIPPPHRKFDDLDEEVKELFNKTFVAGHSDPNARVSAELWGSTFLNSPLMLIDRPLPSKTLGLGKALNQNWYELAVSKAIQELKLAPPPPQPFSAGAMTQKVGTQLVNQAVTQYKKIGAVALNLAKFGGIVLAVIVGFVFFIGLFSDGANMGSAFRVLGELMLIIPRLLFWFITHPFYLMLIFVPIFLTIGKKGMTVLGQKVGDVVEKLQEQLVFSAAQRRRRLEDKQYALFSKRVKLKQRLQEIKTELNILEQVRTKKEENFQRSNGQVVKESNQKIQSDITRESQQIQLQDQKARELMREEAKEVRVLRVEFMNTLKTISPFCDIPGQSPEHKIANLDSWKKKQMGTSEEIDAMAKTIETQLLEMRQDLDKQITVVRERYDLLHRDLLQNGQEYKIKIDDIIQSASEKIRIESKLDSQLLDKSYKKLLKTRNELLGELYDEEYKMDSLNEEIKQIRDDLNRLS